MILNESALREALDSGGIVLTPEVPTENVGPGSIDLRLSDRFLTFNEKVDAQDARGMSSAVNLSTYSFSTFKSDWGTEHVVAVGGYFEIKKHQLVLGFTRERIHLTSGFAGHVEGKSSLARIGLFVHITAPFIHPGFDNELQLELLNVGPAPVRLYPGKEVCQLIVQESRGEGLYEGQHQGS